MSPSGGILDGAASHHVIEKLFQYCDWPECKQSASLPARLSPHSFRVAINTDLLDHGVPLEDVQHLAGHADPRTTRLYDCRQRKVTRNIVERISIQRYEQRFPPGQKKPHEECDIEYEIPAAARPPTSTQHRLYIKTNGKDAERIQHCYKRRPHQFNQFMVLYVRGATA